MPCFSVISDPSEWLCIQAINHQQASLMFSLFGSPEPDSFGPDPTAQWGADYGSLEGRDLHGVRLAHDLRLLYMDSSPPGRPERWLGDILSIEQMYCFKCNDWSYLGQSSEKFRLLLLRGNEVDVLAHQVGFVRTVLPSKIIVPVIDQADGSEIARLLWSGADEVVPVAMDPLEVKLRLINLLRRQYLHEIEYSNLITGDNKSHRHAAIAAIYRLSDNQRDLVRILLEKPGKIVTYAEFIGYSQARCEKMRMKLAYQIHCLRRKLGKRFVIRNVSSQGYFIQSN